MGRIPISNYPSTSLLLTLLFCKSWLQYYHYKALPLSFRTDLHFAKSYIASRIEPFDDINVLSTFIPWMRTMRIIRGCSSLHPWPRQRENSIFPNNTIKRWQGQYSLDHWYERCHFQGFLEGLKSKIAESIFSTTGFGLWLEQIMVSGF